MSPLWQNAVSLVFPFSLLPVFALRYRARRARFRREGYGGYLAFYYGSVMTDYFPGLHWGRISLSAAAGLIALRSQRVSTLAEMSVWPATRNGTLTSIPLAGARRVGLAATMKAGTR